MLHINFVEDDFCVSNLICFGDKEDIQYKFCRYMEAIYYFGNANFLRSDRICQYLRELYEVEWVDDYTIMMKEEGRDAERAIATVLDYDIQLTMQLISLSKYKGHRVYLAELVPWISNLKWISENCELILYIPASLGIPIDRTKQRERDASSQDGLFDFVFKDKHYDCNWLDFKYKILETDKLD
jgi:hypothetical protein